LFDKDPLFVIFYEKKGGIKMWKKVLWLSIIVLSLGLFTACTKKDDENTELIYLTIEELSQFDGLNGAKAYIAVDGKIYDVSNSSSWPNGSHNGFQAGQDLTAAITSISPHGISVLSGFRIIGELIESNEEEDEVDVVDDEIDEDNGYLYLTLAQLAIYNGKDGAKAYIAVDGKIYDVTDSPRWPNGTHNEFQAGRDLTTAIKSVSPHGISVLSGVPIVGELINE
jgi:predicted heme/steroid binding protein